MAIHRLPLWLNKNISFYKLLGCGKSGSFDKHPDWQQWGILTVQDKEADSLHQQTIIGLLYGTFINKWFRFFNCETWTILLQPLEGHGKWDNKEPFGQPVKQPEYNGLIAVLTRATIRLSKLKAFWQNVAAAANDMASAPGFITSVGIGELPYMKQATFSIWNNTTDMKAFAYQTHNHKKIIQKTRKERWYSEDMFVRFKPLKTFGTLNGNDPLAGKL
jgi:hypothetical protein